MGYKYCTRYHCPCVLLRLFDCVRLCVRRLVRVCKRPILALLTVFMLWKVAGDAILQRTGLWSLLGATRHISGAGMAEKALNLDSISGNLVQNVRTKEVRSADSVAERTRLFHIIVSSLCACALTDGDPGLLLAGPDGGHHVHASVRMTAVSAGGGQDQPPPAEAGRPWSQHGGRGCGGAGGRGVCAGRVL